MRKHRILEGVRDMIDPRWHWERPNFEEHPLGAEVTAYLSAPTSNPKV
jgi:coenzyme PQQ precursor peptide PqqA